MTGLVGRNPHPMLRMRPQLPFQVGLHVLDMDMNVYMFICLEEGRYQYAGWSYTMVEEGQKCLMHHST